MKDEALKLALEALETELAVDMTNGAEVGEAAEKMCEAITAIKEALAQPEQEPVKLVSYNCKCGRTMNFESAHGVVAPQRTWVGLKQQDMPSGEDPMFDHGYFIAGMVYADKVLKEKNNG